MNPKVKVRLRVIAILTTLIWMIVIFRFSMDTGVSSHELSDFCVQVFNKAVYHFTGKDLSDYSNRNLRCRTNVDINVKKGKI